MICIASSTGVTARWKRAERPASTPSGIPTASESPTAASVSANVSTLCSQSPIAANEVIAARTINAARRPPKRSTTRVASAVVPAQVSLWKNEVSHETRLSRKFAKPLKIEKTKLGCATLRLSLNQVWKRSRYPESEVQTSEFGHESWFFQPRKATNIAIAIATTSPKRPRHHGRPCGEAAAGAATWAVDI